MKQTVVEMIDYAYQGILKHFPFEVIFHEVSEDRPLHYRDVEMRFAPSSHPVKNLAIAVVEGGKRYAYSGDGNFNEHTRPLYRNCTLLAHEAYSFDKEVRGHARVVDLLQMAKEENVQTLALTHLQRDVRRTMRKEIQDLAAKMDVRIMIPEPGEEHEL